MKEKWTPEEIAYVDALTEKARNMQGNRTLANRVEPKLKKGKYLPGLFPLKRTSEKTDETKETN